MDRTKRSYEKRKTSFWFDDGKQEAAKETFRRLRISTTPQPTVSNAAPPTDLNEADLRKMKVHDLLTLLVQRTGKTMNKRTRKKEILDALLFSSETLPRLSE